MRGYYHVAISITLILISVLAATVATALYFQQGGFGGGHGDSDLAIAYLGLPSILLIEQVPLPEIVTRSNLVLIIWGPALVNLLIIWLPLSLITMCLSTPEASAD